ncbi:MAG: AhpC/TSA family protein [Candidatus Omnitrophica bacterium]|nr:AhpC/TSA family protein [Candidatus Omnitrophota bacterium]
MTMLNQEASTIRDQNGKTLQELSQDNPLLVVFLRHNGCTFCREALADLSQKRAAIEESGVRIALIHMSSEDQAADFFAKYGFDDVPRFSDPDKILYRAFELKRGSFRQLLGWNVWKRGFQACILEGHGVGKLMGDGFQMPGVFLLHRGEIVKEFRHRSAADRPDYQEMSSCELPS